MDLRNEIEQILISGRSRDDEEYWASDRIEALVTRDNWPAVCAVLLELLEQARPSNDYRAIAEVFWAAVLDQYEISAADAVIGLVTIRLAKLGEMESNLAWSITSKLRRLGYLSDYEPLEDPRVQAELRKRKLIE
jgi:hypothetical protein